MNLVHRYILRSVFVTCLGSVLMFAFILLAGSVIKDMLSLLAEGQLTVVAFFKLIALLFPYIFVHALPLGLLTGILLTMGRLSAQSEITALRASGLSVFRLSSSVYLFAILCTAAGLVINFYYGPMAKNNYRQELGNTVQKNPISFIVEKTFIKEFPNAVMYVSEKEGNTLEDIWIWNLDEEQRPIMLIKAQSGYFEYRAEQNDMELVLQNVVQEGRNSENPDKMTDPIRSLSYAQTSFYLELNYLLGRTTFQKKLKWMTFDELQAERSRWEAIANSGASQDRQLAEDNLLEVQMTFHEKFAMAFSALSFAILAVPMGIRAQRKETSANLFIALGLAIAYYLAVLIVGWLDSSFVIRPDLLYWVPNIAFQAIGIILLLRFDRKAKVELAKA